MTPDLARLADRVKRRRIELELGIEPAARSAGMSKDTWKRVEAGLAVRDTSHAKIDQALSWATGSCQKILEGGDPVEVRRPGRVVEFAPVPPEAMEAEVRQAVQNAMVAGTDLTADRIREVNERAIQALRERGILPPADEN
jgi:uncharacterized protein (DUF58 family)